MFTTKASISQALAIGLVHHQAGRLTAAEPIYRRILQVEPGQPEALHRLGVIACQTGRHAAAVDLLRRAIQADPRVAAYHNNLGETLRLLGDLAQAAACFGRALELRPTYALARYNLGLAWQEQGRLDDAEACYRLALQLSPEFAEAHNNLGNVLKNQGNLEQAALHYCQSLEIRPDYSAAHSNALLCEQYGPGVTPAGLAASHAQWQRRHAAALGSEVRPYANRRDPRRTLRLGFVSPDFRAHPVGYFLVRPLEALRDADCEIVCYCDAPRHDEFTARFREAADVWRQSHGLSDALLAEQIRADRIDVLFDLAGHTAHHRLLTFARKPAPIQITWLGYVGTTGLAAMDYLVADRWQVPPPAEVHYCERVLRLADGYVCYDPPADAPPVAPLPALRAGVTFGSFNNPAKITPQVVDLWCRILARVAGARLVLKSNGFDQPSVRRHFAELFAAGGIDPARLELLGPSPHWELLDHYGRIDLALDPFPYNGGLTTCEALWMGVPVITCPGETFAGRHSLGHLSNVGLTDTIAWDLEQYVEIAVSWAGDLARLAAVRSGLRGQVAASPLCDGPRFAGGLMAQLREAWQRWVGE
jgi:predicted O-linked N-acetylglucosamine transferase (SPINDLY family)